MMPDLMENFSIASTDQPQGFGFDFGMNVMEGNLSLDEWITMSQSETSW